jgi:methyl-accepting chemotaxis protein/DNA-binding LacI/PurR family transcriptional regulator
MGQQPTIGFILRDNITSNFDVPLWNSVVKTAEENGANLLTYMTHPVWYSQDGLELNDGIYRQINSQVIDGLVSFDFGLPWVFQRLGHFAKQPNVILNYPVKGYPCITIDQEGMRYTIEHLIKVHHKTRILYISGNKGNTEAEARLQVYKNTLQAHNIPFDPALVFYGDFSNPLCGEAIIAEAIERKLLKFDAVACANDIISSSAIIGLQKHNLMVPYDIAVTGFDDEVRANSSLPTLTTVRASFSGLTRLGTQRLLKLLKHEPVPTSIDTFPTELVIRQSCGCLPNTILSAATPHLDQAQNAPSTQDTTRTQEEMAECLGAVTKYLPFKWQDELWISFEQSIQQAKPDHFIQKLDLFERLTLKNGGSPENWQKVLSCMRHRMLAINANKITSQKIEDLYHQGRIFTAEMTQHLIMRENLKNDDAHTNLIATIQVLLSKFDMDGLLDALSTVVPNNLNINGVYLAVFDEPVWPPENARLILAYQKKRGRMDVGKKGVIFPSQQILPQKYFPYGQRCHLIITPLYFQNENLGYIVFENGPVSDFYGPLQKIIASALKGALLSQQRVELLDHVASNSKQVANASKRLEQIIDSTKEAMYQISQSMGQVAKGASAQADIVNKAVYSIDQMSTASRKIADEAETSNTFAKQAANDAQSGTELGNATTAGMQEIKDKVGVAVQKVKEMSVRSTQISAIIETIEDIASQTNMLALNAAIEAARAGEQGRGFAVVASEVRKLAEKSRNSTKEIASLISSIQLSISEVVKAMEISSQQVSQGSSRAEESNAAMQKIQKAAASLYERVKSISEAATNIAQQSNKMTASIEDIASVTEENTAATEEVNASAEEVNAQMDEVVMLTKAMAEMAENMQKLVAYDS